MGWLNQLDKKKGSRPRCVLLTDGERELVAKRLTDIVGLPSQVVITSKDMWRPIGRCDNHEAQLDGESTSLLPSCQRKKLKEWWLVKGHSRQKWDIASTCKIKIGDYQCSKGLLLVEAKAHGGELTIEGSKAKCPNREQIGKAIAEANSGLKEASGKSWNLSRDSHYQLSNRFAWSWKLASLGVPVVLLYLGFLNAKEMEKDGELFQSNRDWERFLRSHCKEIVDDSCWGEQLEVSGVPLLPLIRTCEQPFRPDAD